MNKTIWKYILEVTDTQTIKLPKGAEVLSVQIQLGGPCMWALVDPNAKEEERLFETFGTGHPIPCDAVTGRRYIGTYQLESRAMVFHVFERLY
jgi:hypothetical protein